MKIIRLHPRPEVRGFTLTGDKYVYIQCLSRKSADDLDIQ